MNFNSKHTQLAYLLYPISIKDFFENYYEQNYLLIKNRTSNYYKDILTLKDLDEYFQRNHIDLRKLLLKGSSSNQNEISPNKTINESIFSKDYIFNEINNGTSLVLNNLSEDIPKLGQFTFNISHEIESKMWSNIYVTPPGEQTFDQHYDTHDVFILHTHGQKKWNLYDTPVYLPDSTQKWESENFNKRTKPHTSITLKPGDLLYIPRGMIHEAATTTTVSIHITLGLTSIKYNSLFKQLEKEAIKNPYFRKTLIPNNHENSQKSLEEDERIFKSILIDEIKKIDYHELVTKTKEDFLFNKIPKNYNNYFTNFALLPQLSKKSTVKFKKGLHGSIFEQHPFICLQINDRVEEFPPFLKSTLEELINGKAVVIKDIRGNMVVEDKLKLVQSLIEKEILDIIKC